MAALAILSGGACGNGDWADLFRAATIHRRLGWLAWPCRLCTGENRHTDTDDMPTNLREVLAVGLFVVMASYVGFSGIRLGLLLWERFA